MSKKKYAEKFVGRTPKSYEEFSDRHRRVLETFSRYKFERILDIGCGDGNFTALVGKACRVKEVYGVDISEKGVEMAKKNGIKAFRVDVDEEDLPFEDNYFDAVLSLEVIEHLYDPDHFLDEVYRVLKPKGIFVLSTPNLAWWINRIALLLGFQPYSMNVSLKVAVGHIYETHNVLLSADHVKVFTVRSLKSILETHNFEILKICGVHLPLSGPPIISYILNIFDKFFATFYSLGNGVIVVSEKSKLVRDKKLYNL